MQNPCRELEAGEGALRQSWMPLLSSLANAWDLGQITFLLCASVSLPVRCSTYLECLLEGTSQAPRRGGAGHKDVPFLPLERRTLLWRGSRAESESQLCHLLAVILGWVINSFVPQFPLHNLEVIIALRS